MKSINIITPENGVGLSRDKDIIKSLLEANGYDVATTNSSGRVMQMHQKHFDLNIFVEVVSSKYFWQSKKTVVIPNPEYFWAVWMQFDYASVFCKTRDSESKFKAAGKKTEYTSFTSEDRFDGTKFEDKKREFVHMAGKSTTKNTLALIEMWNDIPTLPPLHIFTHNIELKGHVKANHIYYNPIVLTDETHKKIQNQYLFHLCPSEYEGFGHYINEGKSTGAVVITLDAAPMNELVIPEFGELCPSEESRHQGITTMYKPKTTLDLKCSVLNVLALSEKKLKEKSIKARESFLENDKLFRTNFINAIQKLI